MNGDEMSNLYRRPSYKFSDHLAERFQRRRLECEKLTDDRLQVMARSHVAFSKVSKRKRGKCRRNKTQLLYICLPPYNSNKMPELVLVTVGDITSSWYIPASSLSILLITKSGLFTWQELPEYLGQLIIRFVQQLLCDFQRSSWVWYNVCI